MSWRGLPLALSFLTVLPLPPPRVGGEAPAAPQGGSGPAAGQKRRGASGGGEGEPVLAAAVPWFPVAGAVAGAVSALVFRLAGLLFPPEAAALAGVLAAYAVTGSLHLDGLADTADGLAAAARGDGRERALAAMRDPRLGARGVLAVCGAVLGKTTLAAAAGGWAWLSLLLAPVLGRWAMVVLMPLHPYARNGPGLGEGFARRVGWGRVAGATVVAVALAAGALAASGRAAPATRVALPAAAALTALAGGGIVARRLGGVTGDVYGAVNELAEVTVLAVAAVLLP